MNLLIMLHLVISVTAIGLVTCSFDEKLHEMYKTMPRADFVKYFNSQNYTWKMREQPHDNGFIGCILANAPISLPSKTHGPEATASAPENFDSRTQWPQCQSISKIYNQGDCGSCWAFGTATTASDRTCIHRGEQVELSEQDFECMPWSVCDGGIPVLAFGYWEVKGLVTQSCKPYDIPKLLEDTCSEACVDGAINYISDKHYAAEVYWTTSNIDSIKVEISKSGPVQATMAVFEDFHRDYHGGIYEHTHGECLGYHSVKVIGYGVENGVSYWIVANSWGEEWGEGGFFRIKQNLTDVKLENSMLAGIPK